jgi:hypothetical protein
LRAAKLASPGVGASATDVLRGGPWGRSLGPLASLVPGRRRFAL